MLLRDLKPRTIVFDSEPLVVTAPARADYFRTYDQARANDPIRRAQIRAAMARYRQRKRERS